MLVAIAPQELELVRDGAQRLSAVFAENETSALRMVSADATKPGKRLFDSTPVRTLLSSSSTLVSIARRFLGPNARPVRALLFNKNAENNWRIGWHQDRTIAVKRRVDVDGFAVWSVKDEVDHVEPPFQLITSMLTLRAHVDDTPRDNAPLLVAPGSHRLGVIKADKAADVARRLGSVACLAESGDVWAYATSILHASDRANSPRERRVLHVDFSAAELPDGLEWFGI